MLREACPDSPSPGRGARPTPGPPVHSEALLEDDVEVVSFFDAPADPPDESLELPELAPESLFEALSVPAEPDEPSLPAEPELEEDLPWRSSTSGCPSCRSPIP